MFWYASAPIPDKIPDKFSGSSQKHRPGALKLCCSITSSHPDTKETKFKKRTTANGLTTVNSGFGDFLSRKIKLLDGAWSRWGSKLDTHLVQVDTYEIMQQLAGAW